MTYRAVFFAADHAQAAAHRLTTDGFTVQVVQQPHAGGEGVGGGHQWVVLTDAPEFVLELLVERYDGWLES